MDESSSSEPTTTLPQSPGPLSEESLIEIALLSVISSLGRR